MGRESTADGKGPAGTGSGRTPVRDGDADTDRDDGDDGEAAAAAETPTWSRPIGGHVRSRAGAGIDDGHPTGEPSDRSREEDEEARSWRPGRAPPRSQHLRGQARDRRHRPRRHRRRRRRPDGRAGPRRDRGWYDHRRRYYYHHQPWVPDDACARRVGCGRDSLDRPQSD